MARGNSRWITCWVNSSRGSPGPDPGWRRKEKGPFGPFSFAYPGSGPSSLTRRFRVVVAVPLAGELAEHLEHRDQLVDALGGAVGHLGRHRGLVVAGHEAFRLQHAQALGQ